MKYRVSVNEKPVLASFDACHSVPGKFSLAPRTTALETCLADVPMDIGVFLSVLFKLSSQEKTLQRPAQQKPIDRQEENNELARIKALLEYKQQR